MSCDFLMYRISVDGVPFQLMLHVSKAIKCDNSKYNGLSVIDATEFGTESLAILVNIISISVQHMYMVYDDLILALLALYYIFSSCMHFKLVLRNSTNEVINWITCNRLHRLRINNPYIWCKFLHLLWIVTEFHIIVCGLDSIIARRWINGMVVSCGDSSECLIVVLHFDCGRICAVLVCILCKTSLLFLS